MDSADEIDEESQGRVPQQERIRNPAFGSSDNDFNPSYDLPFPSAEPPNLTTNGSRGLVFLNRFAKLRACSEGLPTSRFIGSFGFVTNAGGVDIGVLPIIFRCVWPPDSGSRHTLLHLTKDMNLQDLARALDLALKIVDTGGAIASTEIVWACGPETTPNTLHSFSWQYLMLGQLKNGIVEVHVESIADALTCACGARLPEDDWTLDRLRARYDRRMLKSVCLTCLSYRNIEKHDAQEEAGQSLLQALTWDPS